MDYELRGIRAAHAYAGELALVYMRFKNVGTVDDFAQAEVIVYDESGDEVDANSKAVFDAVGKGPGKEALQVTYPWIGTYTVTVNLTDDIETHTLSKTVIIRK